MGASLLIDVYTFENINTYKLHRDVLNLCIGCGSKFGQDFFKSHAIYLLNVILSWHMKQKKHNQFHFWVENMNAKTKKTCWS